MVGMQWRVLSELVPRSFQDVTELLLQNRSILDSQAFLHPKTPSETSLEEVGLDIQAVRQAKERLVKAIKDKQKILVFGDYDADGVCATAIMWETLHSLGANVWPFIPHREQHGYGLTVAAIEELTAHDVPQLLITVDTGIVAHEAVKILKKRRVEVIITDHHQPEKKLPPALAVVHTTQVCGSAVAWLLARELSEVQAGKALDLVALATVADLMPLKGVNRSLVSHGLTALNKTERLGLQALMAAAGLAGKKIDAGIVGYVLAPRINAMGRLAHGLDALRLLCTNSKQRALELASLVDETNADRQQLTEDLLQLARQQVFAQKKESLLIAYSADFHEGVIGLIAGKLAEWYAKPAIVMSARGQLVKGSARSVPGVNITELLRSAREYLLEVGGHPMAAGFGFESKNLDALIKHLFTYAKENIDATLLQKTLDLDCWLPAELITTKLISHLQQFAPFGQANPEPLFALADWEIQAVQRIGSQQQHLKLRLKDTKTKLVLPALLWGKGELADTIQAGQRVQAAGVLQLNQWQEQTTLQLVVRDLQPAAE
ncbi:MAG: Single-stranded-DNA-specific exonuclease RecJ [Candidatus Pacebacteria bacterium GW2011_GWB1_47_8]|nr:MAG: Single-stranded-DNA-specific exonuclease RecJ [Candidatus Pacebacteria bacterium GW2011_GWA1_46_10]KKU84340.1 MAG: Single-stranded-DNA-specific exonuclease RecJ [Candidatus Pacebacteria bacterium GW2011_GWB1_47_8]